MAKRPHYEGPPLREPTQPTHARNWFGPPPHAGAKPPPPNQPPTPAIPTDTTSGRTRLSRSGGRRVPIEWRPRPISPPSSRGAPFTLPQNRAAAEGVRGAHERAGVRSEAMIKAANTARKQSPIQALSRRARPVKGV